MQGGGVRNRRDGGLKGEGLLPASHPLTRTYWWPRTTWLSNFFQLLLCCSSIVVALALAAKHGLIVSLAATEVAVEERSINKQLLAFDQLPRTWTQQNKLHRAKQRCFSKSLLIGGIVTLSLRQWDSHLFPEFQNMSHYPEDEGRLPDRLHYSV